MNLSGHWKGKYTYGEGYPPDVMGISEPFELDINDEAGLFNGTCMDLIVKAKEGNESFIYGQFKDGIIKFKKTYKYHLLVDKSEMVEEDGIRSNGVDYHGKLCRKFFFGEKYFKGKWSITSEYEDEYNITQTFTVGGTWKMSKVG